MIEEAFIDFVKKVGFFAVGGGSVGAGYYGIRLAMKIIGTNGNGKKPEYVKREDCHIAMSEIKTSHTDLQKSITEFREDISQQLGIIQGQLKVMNK